MLKFNEDKKKWEVKNMLNNFLTWQLKITILTIYIILANLSYDKTLLEQPTLPPFLFYWIFCCVILSIIISSVVTLITFIRQKTKANWYNKHINR